MCLPAYKPSEITYGQQSRDRLTRSQLERMFFTLEVLLLIVDAALAWCCNIYTWCIVCLKKFFFKKYHFFSSLLIIFSLTETFQLVQTQSVS